MLDPPLALCLHFLLGAQDRNRNSRLWLLPLLRSPVVVPRSLLLPRFLRPLAVLQADEEGGEGDEDDEDEENSGSEGSESRVK